MKAVFVALLLMYGAFPVVAQSSGERIEAVIASQFEAFQSNDVEEAFSLASPMIKSMFGSPERFGQMVERGYPMVWRPEAVSYTCLTEREGKFYQSVLITDEAGKRHSLDYEMIETDTGWLINGVYFRPPTCLGA